jgi:hypothetical protein
VSLRAACFGNDVYDKTSAVKCISNLLSVGYRRLSVDLYWSPDRRTWSFCPVTIPAGAAASDSSVHDVGPYSCSDGLDIVSLANILLGFFRHTNSQVNVYTTYVVLNLHAAASDSAPDAVPPTLSGTQLPTSEESVGHLLDRLLGMYIYRPHELAKERSNLNESWYAVDEDFQPIAQYFTIHEHPNGIISTPNGWPSAKYVQLAQQRRILLGYGTIDPQLGDLNTNVDENVLFSPGYITDVHDVSIGSNYTLLSGCLYDSDAWLVEQVNSSWALSSRIPVPDEPVSSEMLSQLSTMVSNLTSCGLSPLLNSTIMNTTADVDIDLYKNISLSATWSWATGEPRDATGPPGDNGHNRCALMDLTLNGHWRAANCSDVRPAACRVHNMPYTWTLSEGTADYSGASSVCPEDSSFSVPRTGLENTYLFEQAMDVFDTASVDAANDGIWLDFNSLDIPSCWVTGGRDAECPYASDPQQLARRTVLVSTIAGIVICIIAALTLFVKCNANRRNSMRRKRVIEGWEYEGVPS